MTPLKNRSESGNRILSQNGQGIIEFLIGLALLVLLVMGLFLGFSKLVGWIRESVTSTPNPTAAPTSAPTVEPPTVPTPVTTPEAGSNFLPFDLTENMPAGSTASKDTGILKAQLQIVSGQL